MHILDLARLVLVQIPFNFKFLQSSEVQKSSITFVSFAKRVCTYGVFVFYYTYQHLFCYFSPEPTPGDTTSCPSQDLNPGRRTQTPAH